MNLKKQINIFIVEDNNLFAIALKADIETAFAKNPVKIDLFKTGESCMKRFKEEKPQVVILDYHLNSKNPEAANGIKVCDWIKKANRKTNVIMLTSEDNVDIALKAFQHGASDYVVKTETQFRKINYSLFNVIGLINVEQESKMYKYLLIASLICITFLIIGVFVVRKFQLPIFTF